MGAKILVRISACLICLGIIWTFYIDFQRAVEIWIYDYFNLAALIVVFPAFALTALFGTIPGFITRFFSKDFLDDITYVDHFFTKFNIKSLAFAITALSIMFFYIYTHNY